MTITIIGHLCIDEIHAPINPGADPVKHERFGGIYYTLMTLASIASPKDKIQPVFGVGERDFEGLIEAVKHLANVETDGIFKIKGETNRVHLFYERTNENRIECSNHIAEPIPFPKIKPFLDTDGILINMVSGSDITLETLDKIRMTVRDARTPMHFDFHSLTMGIDQDYKRFRRPLTDWRRWCFMMNCIQMSEEEMTGLTAEKFDEQTLINHLMPLMVTALIITRGDRGVTTILQENKRLTRHDHAAASFGQVVDTVGCGDVFGAAFFSRFIAGKNYLQATEYANQVAGLKATFNGTEGISSITERIGSGSPVG